MGKKSKKKQRQPTPPSPFTASSVKIGDKVVLYNLKNDVQHRGKIGKVVRLPKADHQDERFGIVPEGMDDVIGVRPANFVLVQPSSELKVGDRVVLYGLKTAEFNGKVGKIASLPKSDDIDERYGVLPDGSNAPVGIRYVNLVLQQPNFKSTEQQLAERMKGDLDRKVEGENMDAGQLRMMRGMTEMFVTEEMQIEMYGRKIEPIPHFLSEVLDTAGLPDGVDQNWASYYLEMAFEQASNLPHMFEMYMKMPNYEPEVKDLLKRLGGNDKKKLKWFYADNSRRSGDVYVESLFDRYEYSPLIRHSFSNQAYRKEVLHRGTTHVAVGFVDLGFLFTALLGEPPKSSLDGPLNFLGIEKSAYSVAKTQVIWEMLKQTPADMTLRKSHLYCVAEAWFSTTFSEGTHEAVKSAVFSLCNSSNQTSFHPEVWDLLMHWKNAPKLSLRVARSRKKKFTTYARSFIGHFTRKIDRVAMAKYEVSGDFASRGETCAGNFLMFDCPDGTAPLEFDETVFSALPWDEIFRRMTPATTVVEAAVAFALANISKLASWATEGDVSVDFICAQAQDMVEVIALMKPWTMSWSNVLDYFDPHEFHELARECSKHGDTVHFGYSMNWVTNVCGVNLIDYPDPSARAGILESANRGKAVSYKLLGWARYLRLPIPSNPLNTASMTLEHLYWEKWTAFFFSMGRPCNLLNQEHTMGAPLSSTGDSTIALTWTYDTEIVAKVATNPSLDSHMMNLFGALEA